jgi:hypothetical protein
MLRKRLYFPSETHGIVLQPEPLQKQTKTTVEIIMKKFVLPTLVASATAITAHAATIAGYSFTGAPNGTLSGFADEVGAANITASSLTTSTMGAVGVVGGFMGAFDNSVGGYAFDGKGYRMLASFAVNSSTGVPTHYFDFSVQVNPGYQITFSNLTADFGIDINNATSGGTAASFDLWASVNAGSYVRLDVINGATPPVGTYPGYFVRNDVSKNLLVGAGLPPSPLSTGVANVTQVFTSADTINFRLAFADNNSGATTKGVFVDDIKLYGDITPVPEPSAMALAGLSVMSLALLRRRK